MPDIKDLTKEQHSSAERQAFVKILMSGHIDHNLFATYLYNQYACYQALEACAQENGLFADTPDLPRAPHLKTDYQALWLGNSDTPPLLDSSKDYIQHINNIKNRPELLYSHIYVRHMGDMRGGQMIKKKTPGPNRFYDFSQKEIEEYGPKIRHIIDTYCEQYGDDVIDEAKLCFRYASQLFKELKALHDKSTDSQT